MKSLVFLFFGFILLAVSFHSCAWRNTEPEVGPPETAIVVRPRGGVRYKLPTARPRKEIPMAESAPRAIERPRTDVALAALAQLPTVASVKEQAKQNPHYAPPALLEGLDGLGRMADEAHRGDKAEAGRFFAACALDEATATAVRAVCLRHLIDLDSVTANGLSVPARIRKIANRLAPTTGR